MTGSETTTAAHPTPAHEATAHDGDTHRGEPARKAGSGYFALILLMLGAICLFLAFAFPTFTGIMSLVMQDAAGG
jgi:hypothetical protein